jgi:amidophosphoribosyltransferase
MYRPTEECGVFAIYGQLDAAAHATLGLHALQHRGQEAAGIVSYDDEQFYLHKDLGLVGDIFGSEEILADLPGSCAIGHVRYSTSGDSSIRNVQPLFAHYEFGGMGIAHNGNLTNADLIREQLINTGCLFQSSSDTEIIIHLVATSKKKELIDRLAESLAVIEGAYSLVAMTNKRIIGVRDPYGVRPLSIAKLGDAFVLASETTAFDIIGAEFVRDVEPGEIVWIDKNGLHSSKPFVEKPSKFCIFEYVYFSRPDSIINNKSVNVVRKQIGIELARECPVDADVVIPIPDSGVPAAIGYSQESGIPFDMGIIRNHYTGRTFIQPSQKIRDLSVKLKHLTCASSVKGKSVILIDDSIVRGTTSKKIVAMLRQAGATRVHLRIACPPTTDPCFYGIDTPEKSELIASSQSVKDISRLIGSTSLEFLSIDGLYRALDEVKRNNDLPQYCDACFTGEYPISNIVDFRSRKPLQSILHEKNDKKNGKK